MRPVIRYTTGAGGVRIAFTTYGEPNEPTPLLVLRPPQWSHLEREWALPVSHHEYEAHFTTRLVIRMDPRGTGLSDRYVSDHSLEANVADIAAVLEALRVDAVAIDCISSSGLPGMALAARQPARVVRLVVQNGFASGSDWWGVPARRSLLAMSEFDWDAATEAWAWLAFGSTDPGQVRLLAEHTRACLHQSDFLRMVHCEQMMDLTPELSNITAETLVIVHPAFDRLAPRVIGGELVHLIPGARAVTASDRRARVAAIQAFLAAPPPTEAASPPAATISLTPREAEVLVLLARGLTNRGIAARMTLSVRTVDSHVANIYSKLGVGRRAEAAAYAARHGFI